MQNDRKSSKSLCVDAEDPKTLELEIELKIKLDLIGWKQLAKK